MVPEHFGLTLDTLAFILLVLCAIFVFDDLLIDLTAVFRRLGPRRLDGEALARLRRRPQKKIGIMVANWKEAGVIGRMLLGNVARLDYDRYRFYVGAYPNDPETIADIEAARALHPDRIELVINRSPGPTTKGQMLNQIVRRILEHPDIDIVLMQDSEDILHPLHLRLVSAEMEDCEFLQTPVFSFGVPAAALVGGIYIDEFAELHTKDLLVRESWGAAIPSAGVGTAIARGFIEKLREETGDASDEGLFREDCLTEDYVLGLGVPRRGGRGRFCCFEVPRVGGGWELVATREYFPKKWKASVRQKKRWITGIVFQGFELLGWRGSWVDRYFLYRDRRGPFNAAAAFAATALTLYFLGSYFLTGTPPRFLSEAWFRMGSIVATFGMVIRCLFRLRAVTRTNGGGQALLALLRWPVANVLNFWASLLATVDFFRARWTGGRIRWEKTTHELPADFGASPAASADR